MSFSWSFIYKAEHVFQAEYKIKKREGESMKEITIFKSTRKQQLEVTEL